jgi:hypothetical protein
MSSRLTPDEPFPEDLAALPTEEVEILNSKVHREVKFEHQQNLEVEPETELRLEHLHEELDIRDLLDDVEPAVTRLLSQSEEQLSAAPRESSDDEPDAAPERIRG